MSVVQVNYGTRALKIALSACLWLDVGMHVFNRPLVSTFLHSPNPTDCLSCSIPEPRDCPKRWGHRVCRRPRGIRPAAGMTSHWRWRCGTSYRRCRFFLHRSESREGHFHLDQIAVEGI